MKKYSDLFTPGCSLIIRMKRLLQVRGCVRRYTPLHPGETLSVPLVVSLVVAAILPLRLRFNKVSE